MDKRTSVYLRNRRFRINTRTAILALARMNSALDCMLLGEHFQSIHFTTKTLQNLICLRS